MFSNSFSCTKSVVLWFKFHWNWFTRSNLQKIKYCWVTWTREVKDWGLEIFNGRNHGFDVKFSPSRVIWLYTLMEGPKLGWKEWTTPAILTRCVTYVNLTNNVFHPYCLDCFGILKYCRCHLSLNPAILLVLHLFSFCHTALIWINSRWLKMTHRWWR